MNRPDYISELEKIRINDLIATFQENLPLKVQNSAAVGSLSSYLEGVIAGFRIATQLQQNQHKET